MPTGDTNQGVSIPNPLDIDILHTYSSEGAYIANLAAQIFSNNMNFMDPTINRNDYAKKAISAAKTFWTQLVREGYDKDILAPPKLPDVDTDFVP